MEAEGGGGKAVLGTAGDGPRRLPGHKTAGPGLGGRRGAAGAARPERRGGSAAERPGRPAQVTGAAGSGSPGRGALGRLRGRAGMSPPLSPFRSPPLSPPLSPPGPRLGRAEGTAGPLCPSPPSPQPTMGSPPSLIKGCELRARAASARWAVPWAWNRQEKGARATAGGERGAGTALILFPSFRLFLAQVTPCPKTILPVSREECGRETLAQLCPRARKCPQSSIFVL